MKEKDLENIILEYLSYTKGFFFKVNTVGIYDPVKKTFRLNKNKHIHNGISDIIGISNGKFIAFEVKLPTNKSRPKDQVDFLGMINKHGGIGHFVTSLNEVKNIIETIKDHHTFDEIYTKEMKDEVERLKQEIVDLRLLLEKQSSDIAKKNDVILYPENKSIEVDCEG